MNSLDSFSQLPPIIVFALLLWSIFWKGTALWYSAKANQRNWFIVILVLHTFGILEIIYLFLFAKNKLTIQDIQFWKKM